MLADKAIVEATSYNLVNLVKMGTKRITMATICLLLFIPISWANPDPGPKPK